MLQQRMSSDITTLKSEITSEIRSANDLKALDELIKGFGAPPGAPYYPPNELCDALKERAESGLKQYPLKPLFPHATRQGSH